MGILGARALPGRRSRCARVAPRAWIRRSNQVQSLCRILGAGGPSTQGIALKYS
jgi:hypothetical protein